MIELTVRGLDLLCIVFEAGCYTKYWKGLVQVLREELPLCLSDPVCAVVILHIYDKGGDASRSKNKGHYSRALG